jgi:putative ABC transport system permease protein
MKSIFKLLRWFCPDHLYEEIEGDLIQKFEKDVKSFGERKARRKLWWNTIRFFRPGIVTRNTFYIKIVSMNLIQNYLKITFRNLNRRKVYSLISIAGLALGMAACLVISKYVEFETSYDNFHTNAENIYRVISSFYTDGNKEPYSGYDLGPALQQELPEVKRIARLHGNSSVVSFTDEKGKYVRFYENNINAVDSTFLKIFTFRFIYGNEDALNSPNNLVLTKSVATKYFGNKNPIGAELTLHDNWPGVYTVAAVIEDLPANTHFRFDVLMPLYNILNSEFYRNQNERWDNFHTYLEMFVKANGAELENKIPVFMKKYRGDDKAINAKSELQFQPLLDIHYSPNLERQESHRAKIYFFVLIAAFILIMAWINYVNLATARAIERAREVGVKKALGVLRSQLISQFVFESVLVNFLGLALSVVLAWLMLPLLNFITGQSLTFAIQDSKLWMLLTGLLITGSVASGFYPAFVLSSFKTTEVIKGKIIKTTTGLSLRSGLVVFQFACSLLLIVGTVVIYQQINYLKEQEKGLVTNQVAIVNGPVVTEDKGLQSRMMSFKNELLQMADVSMAATSFSVPAKDPSISIGMRKLGSALDEHRIGNIYWVDPDFMGLYEIPLVSGKFWDEKLSSEMDQIIVNEEAVKVFQLGTTESALREKLITPFDTFAIIGVVKNHHWHSLKQLHQPMIFRVEKVSAAYVSVRLSGDIQQGITQIRQKYDAAFPGETFSYYFLDDYYNGQYMIEQQSAKLFGAFSALAILLGCLGLWALASFTTLYRMKEISVRKVLGASVHSILILLSRQFLKPLLVACLLAFPFAWLGINKWLEQFPYRIHLSINLFLLPLLLLAVIAIVTISVLTIRAALANPVTYLKNE